jgi:hypothetical protein
MHCSDKTALIWCQQQMQVAGHGHVAKQQEIAFGSLPGKLFEHNRAFVGRERGNIWREVRRDEKDAISIGQAA